MIWKLGLVGILLAGLLAGILIQDINQDAEAKTKDVCCRAAYTVDKEARATYYDKCVRGEDVLGA